MPAEAAPSRGGTNITIGEAEGDLIGLAAEGAPSALRIQRQRPQQAAARGLRLYYRFVPAFPRLLQEELRGMESVLDIGCGKSSPLKTVPELAWTLGVDVFRPYLLESKKERIHSEHVLADATSLECKAGSVDAVACLNVLEHLTKPMGRRLIARMEEWARQRVVLYTSNGFHQQEAFDDNPHQEHVSGWNPAELINLGYRVVGVGGWRRMLALRNVAKRLPEPIWNLCCSVSSLAVAMNPEASIDLLCVKNLC